MGLSADRLGVRRQITRCRRCSLSEHCRRPVPFRGPSPNHIAVVGEAPGSTEDQLGEPFIGPAGELLDKFLWKAGIDLNECFVCNAVSCYPSRTPRTEEIEACKVNLADQLVLSRAPNILLLGAVALSVFFPGESIMRSHGEYVFVHNTEPTDGVDILAGHDADEILFFPTYHPAAVLRNRTLMRAWRTDLERFAELVGA